MNIDQLRKITGITELNKLTFLVDAINTTFTKYNITTKLQKCHFLAQVMHESGCFKFVKENLNYSTAGLLSIFPKYFSKEDAVTYNRKPIAIGNRVYANRMGNGNEVSGDGYKFCGRGYLQITGKNAYENLSRAFNIDLIKNPELLEQPKYAMLAAGWFWNDRLLNPIADKSGNNVSKITKIINGGYNGLSDRQAIFDKITLIIV